MRTHRHALSLSVGLLTLPVVMSCRTAMAQSRPYAGGTYAENFDSMAGGSTTPKNWFVGSGASIQGTTVVASDGSNAPASALGYNFGTASSADRALGIMASGGDRSIEVRIRNDTRSAIQSFFVTYDGEQWRVGNLKSPSTLLLRYSSDGVNFVDMGSAFNFTSPRTSSPPLLENSPLDGNASVNRMAGIGGAYTPAQPVPSGGTIYLRWFDADDAGNDPGLAVDNFSFAMQAVKGPPLGRGAGGGSDGVME